MKLSRRGFLIGAAAAAVAPVQAYASGGWVIGNHPPMVFDDLVFPLTYNGPFYFLHPSEWKHFERAGFNMRLCKLIEPIPRTKGDIWKASDPVSRAR